MSFSSWEEFTMPLRQTEVKQYAAELMQKYAITRIGLAFFRKSCVAVCAKSSMGGLN